MKRSLVIFAIVFAIGASAAFVLGARVGTREFLNADAQYKAAILAWQLQQLRAGKTAGLVAQLERALDDELIRHGRYLESRFAWLWPDLKADDETAIRDAVDYRLAHPVVHADPEPESDAAVRKVLGRYRR